MSQKKEETLLEKFPNLANRFKTLENLKKAHLGLGAEVLSGNLSLEERIRKEEKKIPRRNFLKKTVKGIGTLFLAEYIGLIEGCKSPTTPDTGIPVTYTGYLRGLINDSPISSGKIIFNHTTEIQISSGSYTINTGHNLTEGNYHVRIETNEGIPRETRAKLSSSGLYQVKTNLPVDNVIEKNQIDINEYQNWLTSQGSERWLTNKPKFFWYDNSLWHGTGDSIVKLDGEYTVDPVTDASVEDVVNNDVHLYTAGFVKGELHRESEYRKQGKSMPGPFYRGWIVYVVQDNCPWAISRYHEQSVGDIYNGGMSFKEGLIGRAGVSIDTAQTLGIGQQHNSGQILTGINPSELTKIIAKIIYNRAPRHNMHGGVDKE